jgi:hypothetical protein
VRRVTVLITLATVLLTACGGGEPVVEIVPPSSPSDGGTSTPPTTPPPTTPPTTPAPTPPTVGNASLSWIPPTENEDGTALVDLAGYRIYYGNSTTNLDRVIVINGVGTTRYVVDNLTSGTYYFGIRAFNRAGTESAMSGIASKTIS